MITKTVFPKEIYVIICNGISDIGKGWLTSAIGALNPERTLPIKIDPLLNTYFPPHLGVEINEICSSEEVRDFLGQTENTKPFWVSDDLKLYKSVGMAVYPECNIIAGNLWKQFLVTLDNQPKFIRENEYKKVTFNDLSFFLAKMIAQIVRKRKPERVLIEIGGTVDDREMSYLPAAMRYLAQPELLGCPPEIILLSYLDYSEDEDSAYRIKTQYVRHGILETRQSYYKLPIRACFVRRRGVPDSVSDNVLVDDLKNVAFETQTDPTKFHLLSNIPKERLSELTQLFRKRSIFSPSVKVKKYCLISTCLLGIPCQWDGTVASKLLPSQVAERFHLVPVCPEQLGGMSTPRQAAEIVGGDGSGVLDGTNRVVTCEGVDVTEKFFLGAQRTLDIAQRCGATQMITQRCSPSCSCNTIYDGTFSKTIRTGMGVTAAMLQEHGVELCDIENLYPTFGEALKETIVKK